MNLTPDTNLAILTDDERRHIEAVPEEGFIPDFVKWAGMKSDVPPYALKAAALIALSLSAGDTVTVPRLVGGDDPIHLNLYILIVGPSTVARKTTTLNLVRGILPVNAHTGQRYIATIGDTSKEAFTRSSAEAGKTMSPVLYSVDEAAGVFGATKAAGYLKGFDKVLMAAYGHDPLIINRTGGDIEAPRGSVRLRLRRIHTGPARRGPRSRRHRQRTPAPVRHLRPHRRRSGGARPPWAAPRLK